MSPQDFETTQGEHPCTYEREHWQAVIFFITLLIDVGFIDIYVHVQNPIL